MTSWSEIESMLSQQKSNQQIRIGQAKLLMEQLNSTKEECYRLSMQIEDYDKISALLSAYADKQQQEVHSQIESIVSEGLKTVFKEDISLRLVPKVVGRRSELDFVLVSRIEDDTLETSILDARGGGVAAVAGFLIQAVLVMLTPGLRPVLFLDEVFAQVSRDYLVSLSGFLKELVERSDLQIVLVTHSEEFVSDADRVYRFMQKNGVTSAVEGGESIA